jgi:hypothetical protein
VIRHGRVALVAVLALAALSSASAQQATYNYEIPSGQFKRVRIVNVAEGTVLAVVVKLEGRIDVFVAYGAAGDKTEAEEKPPVTARSLLHIQAVRQLSFSVRAPIAGQYYVVLDNRKGAETQAVEVTIAAQRAAQPKTAPKKEEEAAPQFPRS